MFKLFLKILYPIGRSQRLLFFPCFLLKSSQFLVTSMRRVSFDPYTGIIIRCKPTLAFLSFPTLFKCHIHERTGLKWIELFQKTLHIHQCTWKFEIWLANWHWMYLRTDQSFHTHLTIFIHFTNINKKYKVYFNIYNVIWLCENVIMIQWCTLKHVDPKECAITD